MPRSSTAASRIAAPAGVEIQVEGLVQGVGFRPWVYRLGEQAGIRGEVWNGPRGVTVRAFGQPLELDEFVRRLSTEAPRPAIVERFSVEPLEGAGPEGFSITPSRGANAARLSLSPDLATCPDCLRDVLDPASRRYGYAFTNCTACGPRFTIATGAPYDRAKTTMASFLMCPACRGEYENVKDRRFHAQPNACPACGPALVLEGAASPIRAAARALIEGKIVAIKGVGGVHLACDATRDDAVARLRTLKGRDTKPFAVMVADLDEAERIATLDEVQRTVLTSAVAPIVIVEGRDGGVSPDVAPNSRSVGLMLPHTPLHHLLMAEVKRPLVLTSGNRSDEPISIDNDDAIERLAQVADMFLLHDRPIAQRADDSVVRVIAGAPTVLRRSRGYVPRSVRLPFRSAEPVLACGAQLKNTICVVVDDLAFLSAHHGNLDHVRAADAFEAGVEDLQRLLGVVPRVVASDLHPDFVSTRYAKRRVGARWVGVQHHHAHVASVMAEHRIDGEVFGFSYDGAGYGTDGSSWGSELLLASAGDCGRVATFRPLRLPGGDVAVREVWRVALALLWDAFEGDVPRQMAVFEGIDVRKLDAVEAMLEGDIRCPSAHGLGRYFDAVGALGLRRPVAGHEGEVAMLWEQAAGDDATHYAFDIDESADPWQIDLRPGIRELAKDLFDGMAPGRVSARFHNTLARASLAALTRAIHVHGSRPLVLSGGCFQNARLTETIINTADRHQAVLLARDVPPGDGGIALGQALVAAATTKAGRACA